MLNIFSRKQTQNESSTKISKTHQMHNSNDILLIKGEEFQGTWKGVSTIVSVFYNAEDLRGNAKRIITTADMDNNVSTLVVEGYPGSEMTTLEPRQDYNGIAPYQLDELVTSLAQKHLAAPPAHEHAAEKAISRMMREKGFHVQILGAASPGWYKPAEDGCVYRVSSRDEPMPTENDKRVYISVSRQNGGQL